MGLTKSSIFLLSSSSVGKIEIIFGIVKILEIRIWSKNLHWKSTTMFDVFRFLIGGLLNFSVLNSEMSNMHLLNTSKSSEKCLITRFLRFLIETLVMLWNKFRLKYRIYQGFFSPGLSPDSNFFRWTHENFAGLSLDSPKFLVPGRSFLCLRKNHIF